MDKGGRLCLIQASQRGSLTPNNVPSSCSSHQLLKDDLAYVLDDQIMKVSEQSRRRQNAFHRWLYTWIGIDIFLIFDV